MLGTFANFPNIAYAFEYAHAQPMGPGIQCVSDQPKQLDTIQNLVFVTMWLDFQPLKTTKKYEICPKTQKTSTVHS